MMREGDEWAMVDFDEVVAETDRALLIAIEGEETWVARSVLRDDDLPEAGGEMEVRRWVAEENEWV